MDGTAWVFRVSTIVGGFPVTVTRLSTNGSIQAFE
jgi:hypothetical protein